MFNLDLPTEPYWLDLPCGVRVQVRPLTGVIMSAARQAAIADVLVLRAQRQENLDAGMPVDDLPDTDDPVMNEALIGAALIKGLARYGIQAWDGVGSPDGTPLPFSKDGAERLALHPDLMEPFRNAYLAPQAALAAEGNASAAMPNGGSALAANTAEAAPEPASNAQGQPPHH